MKTLRYAFQRLLPYLTFFVVLEFLVRISLFLYSGAQMGPLRLRMLAAPLVGLGFDLATFTYIAIPVLFYALALPRRFQGERADRIGSGIVFFLFTYILLFSAVGEWLFWDEFQTRYNFIAVDYLVYTQEVIGNIQESYPVFWLMAAMALASFFLTTLYYKHADRFLPLATPLSRRALAFAGIIVLSVCSYATFKPDYAEISDNRYLSEVARNGIFELFSAFNNNELDYNKFYLTRPIEDVAAFVRKNVGGDANSENPLARSIDNHKQKKHNLVVITVESLSADYLARFGNSKNITPHLDALIPHSLFFSNLYATGSRTVYGLSAITLSMPPVPGNSIVRRPDNGNLYSLGSVLKDQGYETKFIYGGFGYFDNMNAFFGANGYQVVDRNNLAKDEIHFANIWGVSDDDLFRRTMKENDKSYASGKPFFDMLMTTSNHRPYTFPPGKIDLPTGGRGAGVKFTDFAIDEFLKESAKKPWFKDTIFVIVADHTAGSSGKSDLTPDKHHIPLWIYAPGIVKPGDIDWMASQIDIAPTVLGLMGVDYESHFYGKDLLKEKPDRAFISNYQKLGYLTKEGLVILEPNQVTEFLKKDANGDYKPAGKIPPHLLDEAIGYYQGAAQWRSWSKQTTH